MHVGIWSKRKNLKLPTGEAIMLYKIITLVCSLLILLFLLFHDWIDAYPLNDLKRLNRHCSFKNKILMTLINVPFFVIYLGILLMYWSEPFSFHARFYLTLCNIVFCIGIIFSWWLPYVFGWPKSQAQELGQMYNSTHTFLPRIGTNPTPDTLHILFYAVFIINMIATFLMF